MNRLQQGLVNPWWGRKRYKNPREATDKFMFANFAKIPSKRKNRAEGRRFFSYEYYFKCSGKRIRMSKQFF
jgi:hypothetical protein